MVEEDGVVVLGVRVDEHGGVKEGKTVVAMALKKGSVRASERGRQWYPYIGIRYHCLIETRPDSDTLSLPAGEYN